MMNFTLQISTGNVSMQDAESVAAAVRDVAEKIEGGFASGSVFDVNGNRVGRFSLDAYSEES